MKAIHFLKEQMRFEGRSLLSFEEYLEMVRQKPLLVLRNIFQLFCDMVESYVGEGIDEYPNDPESIGFVKYDCSKLFVEGASTPFWADRLFANRFVRQVKELKHGFQQNHIYVYYGPSGCGKSTFLNNLLWSFEEYTKTEEGRSWELVWELDLAKVKGSKSEEEDKLFIPCPSHDYPILIIPQHHRTEFLRSLFSDKPEVINILLGRKDYEWLFWNKVCSICSSLWWSLLDRLPVEDVLKMVKVRPYKFDRGLGEGISVFNPGDKPIKEQFFTNNWIQEKLDKIFGPNAVRYIYSHLAKTNNGIYVLMDIKLYNQDRLLELHNIISEGVHKVLDIEEPINSLFIALMNPEDKGIFQEKKMESFQGRMKENKIPFVLEPRTEVSIWLTLFGKSIEERFLPHILDNFAKVIIASRMNWEVPEAIKEWIKDLSKYKLYCDANALLLRMDLYSGIIPPWLTEEDRKRFTAPVRKSIIAEGEKEGDKGIDGRLSIALFREFWGRYSNKATLINMNDLVEFFKHGIPKEMRDKYIPKEFLASLTDSYDFKVLNEVREALYFYNEKQIKEDILNYLCAVNYEVGDRVRCIYTNEEFELTMDFLKLMATRLTGRDMEDKEAIEFARTIQRKLVLIMTTYGKEKERIMASDLFKELLEDYSRNLKERVLDPFEDNPNFREAIKAFGTEEFKAFDSKIKTNITRMIGNLQKIGYSEQGAKEICLYVIDKNLVKKFANR